MQVRVVACPSCGGTAGEQCVGRRGKVRESNHLERVEAAEAVRPETERERCARLDLEAFDRLLAKGTGESTP